ncbi:MAG: hypothetical protein HFG20_11360 [Anaerotruncus sp.]|nr:hypothetical protein [Anaerotruncus sp.]
MPDYESLYQEIAPIFGAAWLKERAFAGAFRDKWQRTLRASARGNQDWLPENPDAIFAVSHTFQGVTLTFHFDQLKLADWFAQDSKRRQRRVFQPQTLTRRVDGSVGYYGSPMQYTADAPELCIPEKGKEIFVCTLPGLPPILQTVYGNKRVENRFHGLLGRNKLEVFFIGTEFTPAFLCGSFEMCVYLFWIDCCILQENYGKLKDDELKGLLHIFRSNSMLTLKGFTPLG